MSLLIGSKACPNLNKENKKDVVIIFVFKCLFVVINILKIWFGQGPWNTILFPFSSKHIYE